MKKSTELAIFMLLCLIVSNVSTNFTVEILFGVLTVVCGIVALFWLYLEEDKL